MKVDLQVRVDNNSGGRPMMRRRIELPFVPAPGTKIESTVWKEERDVKAVWVNVDSAPCTIALYLGCDEGGSLEMYAAEGWEPVRSG